MQIPSATPTFAPPPRTPPRPPTPTATPTATLTPTQTPLPTPQLLVQPGTPLPLPLQMIGSGNASLVSGLAEWQETNATDLAWAPDGRSLAVANPDTISMFDIQTRLKVRSLYPRSQGVVSLAFSPDGRWLVAGSRLGSEQASYGSNLELWAGPDWRPIGLFHGETKGLSQVAFSMRGEQFVAAFTSLETEQLSLVQFFDTRTWNITTTLETGTVLQLALSSDGSLMATTPDRYAIRVYNLKKRSLLYSIPTSFTGSVKSVAFAPGGGILASGHYDGAIRIWDMATGGLVRTLKSKAVVESLAFSPDGSLLASGDSYADQDINLWEVATGNLLRTLSGHQHAVDHVRFSPDGQLLASSSYDGSVRLWGVRR